MSFKSILLSRGRRHCTLLLAFLAFVDFVQCQKQQGSATATMVPDVAWTSESEVWPSTETKTVLNKPKGDKEKKFPGFDIGREVGAGKSMGFSPIPQGIPQPLIMFLAAYGDILSFGMIALTLTFTFIVMMMACCLCCRHFRRSRKYKLQHKHSLQLRSSNGTANSQIWRTK